MKKKKAQAKKDKLSAKSGSIEFCTKCGAIMLPVKKGKNLILKCRSCGSERKKPIKDMKIFEEKKTVKGVVVLEKDESMLPTTEKMP